MRGSSSRGWAAGLLLLTVCGVAGCGGSQTATTSSSPGATASAPGLLAPTRLVSVHVLDGDTGTPVSGARVAVSDASRRGKAVFAWPRGRSELVQVSAPGYESLRERVSPAAAASLTVHVYSRAGQWPIYGVTPQRTQDQSGIHLRPPFRIAWGRDLGALLEFPAVVDDGVAYLSNAQGQLFALSMRNGATLWSYDMHTSAEASSPAVEGPLLVAHAKSGRIDVLDRASGRLLWSRTTAGEIESSPVVSGGVDYLGDWSGRIYALDLATRRFRWIYDDGCKITASAALSGGSLYIGDYCGRIVALDRSNGKLLWSAQTGSPVYGASAVAGGRVFVPSRDAGALFAFSTHGAYLWHVPTGNLVYSAPAVWQGRVYFGSYAGVLYCVAAATGSVLWQLPVGGRISGSPTVVDGIVYVGDFSHSIVGAQASSGKVVFQFPHGEYVAVSGNSGRLLLYGWADLWAVRPRSAGRLRRG